MQKGFICVAGIDLATGRHVRPLLNSQMRKDLLARYGGPFDIGRIVDLGWTKYVGARPETEDYVFHRSEARCVGDASAGEFWERLKQAARPSLREIFGNDLSPCGASSYAVDVGRGVASLGCYVASSRARLFLQRRESCSRARIRLQFRSGRYDFQLAVTDIRLYGSDHATPDSDAVQRVARRLEQAPPMILGVGLTRAFQGDANGPARHWLQVNNLHFEDEPNWRLR